MIHYQFEYKYRHGNISYLADIYASDMKDALSKFYVGMDKETPRIEILKITIIEHL